MARTSAGATQGVDGSSTRLDELKRAAVTLRLAIIQEERAAYFNLSQMLEGGIVLQSPEEIAHGVVEKRHRLDAMQQEIWSVDPSWE